MPEQEWPSDADDDDAVDVRFVQPADAIKEYRCPGCDHDVRVGEFHVVVVPRHSPGDRRHWHRGCWERHERGGRGPVRTKR
jgi:hypothetical protein